MILLKGPSNRKHFLSTLDTDDMDSGSAVINIILIINLSVCKR